MPSCDPNRFVEEWVRIVRERDPEQVLALYDESAVLIPTFSNRLLSRPERIREYFEVLCNRDGLQISLHEKPRVVSAIGESLHTVAGIYRWRFAVDDEPLDFEARFTFLLDLQRTKPILHHHSSQIPRTF